MPNKVGRQCEAGEMVGVTSTQGAGLTQRLATAAPGVMENRSVVRTERIGEIGGVAWGGV